jgi:hypothetical protein
MEVPDAVGHYVSQWAKDTLLYFEKTDYLTDLLLSYYPTRASFKSGYKIIKKWLTLGFTEDNSICWVGEKSVPLQMPK